MSSLQAVRGTRDLLPEVCRKFRHIEKVATEIVGLYGFEEIETPVLEASAVFKRTLGDTSDIVTKQMYTFMDLGGDELVLRPEGTAGVARAFISEGMSQLTPLKLFYRGPMFRYERPQKGRYRQFYQMGCEILGVEKPQADLEIIALGHQILKSLDLEGTITLHLNTIGDPESRAEFREKLVGYLNQHKSELSVDSVERLEKNPLRILDSKDEGDRRILKEAPVLSDCLNDVSRDFFKQVTSGLEKLNIPYVIDPLLVRGLDYYCHTVFEFTTDALGSQNAVCSGGRYDSLISDLGGPKTAGVGWGAGLDRLVLMLKTVPGKMKPVALIPLGADAELKAIEIAQSLRASGIATELGYSGNTAKRMKRADGKGSTHAIIFGTDELAKDVVQFKTLATGEQREIPLKDLISEIRRLKGNELGL
jgi:histidyl-tRNA synthetase